MRCKNEKKINMNISILQASKLRNCTKQSIVYALKKNRLKGEKIDGKWMLKYQDFIDYINSRWDRKYSKFNDEPLYNREKGEYSVEEASRLLCMNIQRVYYALRNGKINGFKKKKSWVIRIQDISNYRDEI